jgi:hypothetical protein
MIGYFEGDTMLIPHWVIPPKARQPSFARDLA